LTEGDILFFYHAVTAKQRISSLLKKATVLNDSNLVVFLKRSKALADRYSGTILGYAVVSGQSMFFDEDNEDWHFKGKVFAPLEDVHIFDQPLHSEVFTQTLQISRQSALTYLTKNQFTEIKRLLSLENTLPIYLADAEFAEASFKDITKDNWISIACANDTRFALEIQLRSYLLDYFLAALKDSHSPLLEECHCHRNGINTGFADYFVKLYGKWIPIEAKLNIKTEKDIFEQVAKYIHIDSFTPTKGTRKRECFAVNDNSFCIIIDQFGIYFVVENDYKDCSEDSPVWKRTDINHAMIATIREKLMEYIVE